MKKLLLFISICGIMLLGVSANTNNEGLFKIISFSGGPVYGETMKMNNVVSIDCINDGNTRVVIKVEAGKTIRMFELESYSSKKVTLPRPYSGNITLRANSIKSQKGKFKIYHGRR